MIRYIQWKILAHQYNIKSFLFLIIRDLQGWLEYKDSHKLSSKLISKLQATRMVIEENQKDQKLEQEQERLTN